MKSYEIEDIRNFMNDLLVHEKYDSFYMYEARIRTKLDYYINGRMNQEFFDKDELEVMNESGDDNIDYVCWREVKTIIYDLIKGKRLPISFKLILMFNKDNIEKLIDMNKISIKASDVSALFFNIYYENEKLTITTGTSMKIFTLDKALENIWDETVEKYYI